jgi:NAD(P)-dependent dehydrogenase (short-subunit alcohol dehydrogenase family)
MVYLYTQFETNMGKLDGKIALITGGSEGIGLATAQQFVAEGAYVFITGRRKEALDAAVKQIGNKNVTAIQADSAKLDDIDNVIKVIQKEKGKLHILFANAGIFSAAPIGSITEKSFDDIFNVNVKGVLLLFKKLYQSLLMVVQSLSLVLICQSKVLKLEVFIVQRKQLCVHLHVVGLRI